MSAQCFEQNGRCSEETALPQMGHFGAFGFAGALPG
jgi:hypothetical protein